MDCTCPFRYAVSVLQHLDLTEEWSGWRLRGRWLISPEGERINPQRLRGILYREHLQKRVGSGRRERADIVPIRGATDALARHADR